MMRIIVLLIVVFAAATAAANSLLVLPDGSGPYPDLQTAVAAAADGDTVVLGDGIFEGVGNRNLSVVGRKLTFRSLSGDANVCAVDIGGTIDEQSRFLFCQGTPDNRVTLVDLELRHGFQLDGGGCIWAQGLTLVLTGCVLRENRVVNATAAGGGAIFAQDGDLSLIDCVFVDNESHSYGMGGGNGGAVRTQNTVVTALATTFAGNSAAGHLYAGGNGGAIASSGGRLSLEDCALSQNRSLGGPAVGGAGGAVWTDTVDVRFVRDGFVEDFTDGDWDTGGNGGAVICGYGTLFIEGCEFLGNNLVGGMMGVSHGGALAVFAGEAEVRDTVFVGNMVGAVLGKGGAFALNVSEGQGAAHLTRCTFAGNFAGVEGGTVFVVGGGLNLEACIIAGAMERDDPIGVPYPGPAAVAWNGTIAAVDCDVWGNGANWSGPLAGQDGQVGNFSANPCFCDTTAGDYHLCADSQCTPEHNVAHPGVLVGALPVGCGTCDCDDDPMAVSETAPAALRLLCASPNPFNPTTVIRFALPVALQARLTVHDLTGRRVATLVDGACEAGEQTVTWRGRDDIGRAVAGGTYLLRLDADGAVVTDKLTLLK